jgi:L-asparaginase / beta-aspartyl-peptidase
MDAAVMWGASRDAGSVAAVTGVRHPVALARLVMEETSHLMVAGQGAARLAEERGLEMCDPDWFVTERQRDRWTAAKGTVGAVALDGDGHLAAATSTGGMKGQLPGRVGDSPVIGAGTYAEDGVCAVSATGDGELIVRATLAAEIAALMRLAGLPLQEAAERAVKKRLAPLRAEAGLIAVDHQGNVTMPFNTTVMHRGMARNGADPWSACLA